MQQMNRLPRRRRWRYAAGAVSLGFLAAGAVEIVSGHSPAGAAVDPGQGSASAQAIAVQPHEGSLATGAVMGEALAGHTGNYARAQSQGLDLGAIGLSLKGYDCSNLSPAQGGPVAPNPSVANSVPTALEVETPPSGGQASQTIGAQQGYNLQNAGNSNPNPSQAPPPPTYGWTESVLANAVPYAEAETDFVQNAQAGLVSVANVSSKAWSGLVDGQREAGATVDIGAISIGAGPASVSMGGLHWNAVYPSGSSATPTATFAIGSLSIGGLPVAVPSSTAQLQSEVDTALAPLGIKLVFPVMSTDSANSSISYSPLQVEVVPSPTRDAILNGALNQLSPTTNQLFLALENGFPGEPNQLLDVLCRSDSAITVADIALASITGGGYANASFGGVTASSSDIAANPYQLFGFTPGSSTPGQTEFIPGTPGTPPTPGSQPSISTTGTPAANAISAPSGSAAPSVPPSAGQTAPAATPSQPMVPAAATGFAGGGPLLAIGLGGLGLLGLMAEGDRRMMRRAQRTVTFEE